MKPSLLLLFLFIAAMACAKEKKTILYSNGRVQYEYEMEGHFFDGKFSSYYENGKLRMKGQFLRNLKSGSWRVWDEKGLLRSERNYIDNENFTIISECDSTGAKIRRAINIKDNTGTNYFEDALFIHRYISSIEKSGEENAGLFSENGFIQSTINEAAEGGLTIFNDDRFVSPNNKPDILPAKSNLVSLLIKEEYKCSAASQTMNNKLLAICPVVIENGKRKELGWIYLPDIKFNSEALVRIKNHQYFSTIL